MGKWCWPSGPASPSCSTRFPSARKGEEAAQRRPGLEQEWSVSAYMHAIGYIKKASTYGVCRKGTLGSISQCCPAAHAAVTWQQAAAQPSAPLKQQLWGEVCAFQPAQLSLLPHLLLPKYFQQLCWVQGMRQGSLRQDYLTLQNSSIFKVVFHKDKKQCRYQTRDE